jgi:sphingomyelin phosphodiesterase
MLNRFENTISAQFYGHTHRDEFNMFYDENDHQRPVSMVSILPSRSEPAYLTETGQVQVQQVKVQILGT